MAEPLIASLHTIDNPGIDKVSCSNVTTDQVQECKCEKQESFASSGNNCSENLQNLKQDNSDSIHHQEQLTSKSLVEGSSSECEHTSDCSCELEVNTISNGADEELKSEDEQPKINAKPHLKQEPLNGLTVSVINHPAYRMVIQELAQCKDQVGILESEINRLESENQRLEADRSHEIYVIQLETLEKTISQLQHEQQRVLDESRQQSEIAAKVRHDLETKLEKMTKQYEAANREKEAMVMRYAVSEKEVIDGKKERELMEKRLREAAREKDLLYGKLKCMSAEKSRICQMLDIKCHELSVAQKENEKIREDLNSREIKIKWAQNKLKTEIDAHKETQAKMDKLILKLQETREESEQVRRDCQAMIQAYQESQENKAHTLDQQLKEQQAKLIMERHEREDKEETQKQLQMDVENLKRKNQLIIDENNLLSVKVQNLEKERLEYEQNLSRLKRTTDCQRQDVVDLQAQLAEMESLRIQLQHEQEKLAASQSEVERLRLSNAELQQDMAVCREREAELLDFTQKLTDKNVRLQSEFSATEAKAQQLECEIGPLQHQIADLESRVSVLTQQLEQEKQLRQEENQLLARHLAERTQKVEVLAQELEDQKGENQLLRRKQSVALKELTRELQQCRKKLDMYESSSGSNSLGQGSRASSNTSLNTVDGNMNKSTPDSTSPTITCNGEVTEQSSVPVEPDRQMLIERIVKLQRANARKTEKLDFMEEHVRQLVAELQKKTRIVQHYIMREQTGALSSDSMDKNKAELTRYGGIMASVYGSRAADNTMTLDLSLEINKKLQAVLEDTLLKNITLKENIDTLGEEIARLTMQKKTTEQIS